MRHAFLNLKLLNFFHLQDIAQRNEALRTLEEAHSSDLLKFETTHAQITELSSHLAAIESKGKELKVCE